MATYQMADLDKWALQSIKVLDAIASRATDKMITRASRTATGVSEGGTLQRGFVPFADGDLAGSLRSTLYGSTSMMGEGEASHEAVVGAMKAGDIAEFEWTSEYAMRLHYGFVGEDSRGRYYNQPGWHWLDESIANWQSDVDEAVAEAKAELG